MYVGKYLFNPRAQEGWSKDDDLLAQMMELTELKRFPIKLLENSEAANKFFDYDGNLPGLVVLTCQEP